MAETHTFDTLDFRLLHALQIDGRASFSRIAAVLGVSDQTIARRFRRLSSAMELRIVGVRDAELLGQDSWMLCLRVKPDAAEAVARALARRPDTSWIGLTSAGTEIVCTTSFSSAGEHEELILGKLPRTPSITDIRAHQLLHRFFRGPNSWFGKDTAPDAELVAELTPEWAAAGEPAQPLTRDSLDAAGEALLRTLERDGRAPHAELARVCGLSESAVRRRLDHLLRSGGVYIDTEFSTDAIGYTTHAILWVTAEPRSLDTVGRALARQPEVAAVFATTGESNLTAVAICRGAAELYRYLNGAVGRLDGVQRVEVSPVLRRIKQLVYEDGGRRRPGG
ncbi:Lrp/AsnC family transcriptional regulator [Streptomyces sp. NBC_01497]|uniref:Lrp/AsnC family transcriptional regulator n=1 Tax=Streptomyces sp. NBC_01497 TaxID=2903885 RepID=UPI002E2EF31F|nr:AsnC family transcriptional regulator [Streptomyces sp. NBC_01497]